MVAGLKSKYGSSVGPESGMAFQWYQNMVWYGSPVVLEYGMAISYGIWYGFPVVSEYDLAVHRYRTIVWFVQWY